MTARHVQVCPVMGTVASAHVIGGAAGDDVRAAIESCFDVLRRADRVFSMYDSASDVRRIARGELRIADADPWVAEVEAACDGAEFETRGLFSAHPGGVFDPTGYVKRKDASRYLRLSAASMRFGSVISRLPSTLIWNFSDAGSPTASTRLRVMVWPSSLTL